MMKKWQTIIVFCALLTLVGVYGAIVSPTIVWGQDGTIPTRTPTPGSGGPTATSSSPTDTPPTDTPPTNTAPTATSSSATNTPPTATNPPVTTATSTPATSATPTTIAAATFTPTSTVIGEFPFPEAEQCGEPPTITSLVIVNVYAGPGSDYPVVETLAKEEVRPIIGRAQYAEWWQILLDATGETGWVNDKAGVVNGYTGNVPIVAAPDIDGQTPTPGTPWNPTPVPHCTVTPTATATPTQTATTTPTATSASAASVVDNSNNDESTNVDESESTTESGNDDADTADSTTQTDNRNAETEAKTEADATAVPLESASNSSNTTNILPIVGLVLIVGSIFTILFLRRGRGGGEAPTTEE